MGKLKGFHITVSGMVQGVGYRYYCLETARIAGLTGYVMNKDDGKVELEVFGEEKNIQKFIAEATRTDRTFSVTDFIMEDITPDKGYKDFTIKFY